MRLYAIQNVWCGGLGGWQFMVSASRHNPPISDQGLQINYQFYNTHILVQLILISEVSYIIHIVNHFLGQIAECWYFQISAVTRSIA